MVTAFLAGDGEQHNKAGQGQGGCMSGLGVVGDGCLLRERGGLWPAGLPLLVLGSPSPRRLCSLPAPAPLPDSSSLRSQHSPGRPYALFTRAISSRRHRRARRSLVAAAGSPTTYSFIPFARKEKAGARLCCLRRRCCARPALELATEGDHATAAAFPRGKPCRGRALFLEY